MPAIRGNPRYAWGMTTAYRLHYAPDNASLIIRLALEDLGIAYHTALIDRTQRAQDAPAYRQINPNGLIPALETPEGPIFETGAILLWLADRHPGPLAPAMEDATRGEFLKWLFFLSNTLHPALRMRFYPEKYIGADPAMQIQLRRHINGEIARHLEILEIAAAQSPAFPDAAPNAICFYLACLLRWHALYPIDDPSGFSLDALPHLHAICAGVERTQAAQIAAIAEGLGPTPFTAPRYADPPLGSAT